MNLIKMNLIKRLKNLYKISEIEVTPQKMDKIKNVIDEPPVKMAQIIHLKDTEKIISELIEDQ